MAGSFRSPLPELKEYLDTKEDLCRGRGPVSVSGGTDSQKVHQMAELGRMFPLKLVVTYNDARAKDIYEDYRNFDRNVFLYPARDLLFYNADIQGSLLARKRLMVLKQLLEEGEGTIITTVDGCMDHLMPLSAFAESVILLEEGQELDLEELRRRLIYMGYDRCAQVEQGGQFCVRGGILDIFPLTEENPVRVELWGDEIDSIRSFDVESQRSIERLEQVRLYPARELVLDKDRLEEGTERLIKEKETYRKQLKEQKRIEEAHRIDTIVGEMVEELREGCFLGALEGCVRYFCPETVSFLEYFKEGIPFFLDEPARIIERANVVEAEFRESMTQRLEKGYLLPGQTDILYSVREVSAALARERSVLFSALEQKTIPVKKRYSMTVKNGNSYHNGFELLVSDLKKWKKEGWRVALLCASRTRGARLAKDLQEQYDLRAYYSEEEDKEILPGEICVLYGSLHRGFEYPMIKFVVIPESDMFGTEKKKRRKRTAYEGKKIQSFSELSAGDYVVHENHGLGIYRGIEKIEVDKIIKDYIKIEYAGNGSLYLPVTQLDMIQKYAGAGAKKPKLNKLGGQEWGRTKSRVKGAVKEIARDLVQLYAARQHTDGFQYGPDTVWQKEFEELFPYEATEDQELAIEATKRDMESKKIMDRLICGDVGYGKTEIAIRAAFKAVQEGKQVVYLVPTTILAQQHYNTFVQRMMDFPVRVDMLSRFRSAAEQKKTLADLKKGLVDILIGTHRVLSDDVVFKDLGLLIIDEEQRFGVAHKEKIKKMRENVDVLTLTATPIPRTLHMSLVGIRDMSVLEEPPMDRVPIQTYVMEYNEEMVREAIERERARGGQVYYVYNRVQDIEDITSKIAELVPDAVVVYAHGQMRERQLEKIMLDFINGEIDVLVSTTIIETGLDISNVNTMIIHDADRFGLSQLYQLRGRVGRSNRTAYAFLMYRRNKLLKEEAEKRLAAIREFTELGSGIKIAMRDLEIRGAGNLLGAEQHGHMEAIGYDLYCKLLNEAVKALKGEGEEESFETAVDFNIDAYIPPSYIKNEVQKLEIYKRISGIEDEEEAMDMRDELTDRFGDLPRSVENLLEISLLKAMAHKVFVTEITGNRQEVRLVMYEKAPFHVEKIPELVKQYGGTLRFTAAEQPYFTYMDRKRENRDGKQMLEKVKILLNAIKELLV
ncbi:transcription-repair coupling factor [Qiania dongpingensis]|uniref:Transcription-repair-coupling factor n=1 Tax=Qiania dongpingensis TaxID=2763669 RepID=A0A7G9G0J8_9FIRM|nr:transcription-repair coupling factor [Qiania dongpingensis]QNM04330.1 transcription-repair coupling factor [Qiania dongpingensis]